MENFVRIFSLFLYKNAVVFIYLYTFIYIFISFSFVVVPVNCANSAVHKWQETGVSELFDQPKEKKKKKDVKVSAKTKFCLWGEKPLLSFMGFKVFWLIIQDILGE